MSPQDGREKVAGWCVCRNKGTRVAEGGRFCSSLHVFIERKVVEAEGKQDWGEDPYVTRNRNPCRLSESKGIRSSQDLAPIKRKKESGFF